MLNSQVSDFSAPELQDMKSRLSHILDLQTTPKQHAKGESNHVHLTEMQFTLNISATNVKILFKTLQKATFLEPGLIFK